MRRKRVDVLVKGAGCGSSSLRTFPAVRPTQDSVRISTASWTRLSGDRSERQWQAQICQELRQGRTGRNEDKSRLFGTVDCNESHCQAVLKPVPIASTEKMHWRWLCFVMGADVFVSTLRGGRMPWNNQCFSLGIQQVHQGRLFKTHQWIIHKDKR